MFDENSDLENKAVQNYEDNNTPNAHAKLAIYPNNGSPQIVSDYGVQALVTTSNIPKTVHTSITGTGSDYYDISCPGIKYGAAVIAQFASQRNEYYILNADAMADNTVRLRVNKAVPTGTGIYVNAIYSTS